MSVGCATARAILIRVLCAVIGGHGEVWVCAAAEGYVWVHVPTAVEVCVDVHGLYSYWRLC